MKETVLEKIQVDLVYKYIDLTDPDLHREKQIRKDYDNEELRYSLRSAIQNLPWIHKIYIIMPNEKVRFLKEKEWIEEKIVYIRDSDLIGYDSSSSTTFEYQLWKLKKFGCSEHIIYANDDTFFGNPLRKSDFFYEQEGRIMPYTIYKDEVGDDMRNAILKRHWFCEKFLRGCNINSMYGYYYKVIQAHTITCRAIQGKKLIFPKHPLNTLHNAIPLRLSEVKICYDLIRKYYEYPKVCLMNRRSSRHQPSFQTLYSFYFVNKENREINHRMRYTVSSMNRCTKKIGINDLFCINTGADGGTKEARKKASRLMKELFPTPTPYERLENI